MMKTKWTGILPAVGLLLAASAEADEFFRNQVLPKAGEEFRLVYKADSPESGEVKVSVTKLDGTPVKSETLVLKDGRGELPLKFDATAQYRAQAVYHGETLEIPLPVVTPKREVNVIYYGFGADDRPQDMLQFATLFTVLPKEQVATQKERGAKVLQWSYGSNYITELSKELLQKYGIRMTPSISRDVAERMFTGKLEQTVQDGFEGYGLDEMGGYYVTPHEAETIAFVDGIIAARPKMPEDFVIAAWHAGPIRDELMGRYKEGVDFLLLESYLLEIVPEQLGTERMDKDKEGRLMDARLLDSFTAPYDSPCRVIATVDATDKIPLSEYEAFIRMMRRNFPEVRGIGFFNILKERKDNYRAIDRMCYDYYVRPVLTFQNDSLQVDRYGEGKIVANLSNIGAIDSEKVTCRLLVNGKPVGEATVAKVPAGFSRLDNRAAFVFDWKPEKPGVYTLRVEVADAPECTLLDPAVESVEYWQ